MEDDGPTLSERIRRIEDRIEIEELVSRYVLLLDAGRIDEFSVLFTDDGIFSSVDGQFCVQGRAAILEFFRKMSPAGIFQFHVMHHMSVNISAEDSDHATGMHAGHVEMMQQERPTVGAYFYYDRYKRLAGRWKLASRKVDMHYLVDAGVYLEAVSQAAPIVLR